MPSKATMFNNKCEVVAEFGEGARNTVMINPVGNLALIGGFGNIAPRYEVRLTIFQRYIHVFWF